MEFFSSKRLVKHLGLETTLSSRNQITIPMRLIKAYGLQVGDKIRFLRLVANDHKSRMLAEVSREGKRFALLRIQIQLQGQP
jgi:bifunctional DNA-binding transcriptional regulator/antitoxin component of YhaV-PrlF toxin-antitoxin module